MRTWERVPGEDFFVPHLQRLSPDGRALASYDADRGVMRLRAADGPSRALREFEIADMPGHILQFRWAARGDALLMMTTAGLYRVSTAGDDPRVVAQELFSGSEHMLLELRATEGGVLLHAQPRRVKQRGVWLIAPSDAGHATTRLTSPSRDAQSFTVLPSGQVVVELAGRAGAGDELETFAFEGGRPRLVHARPCVDGGDCTIINWSAGASSYAYATQRCPGYRERGICKPAIVHVTSEAADAPRRDLEFPSPRYGGFPRELSQLWVRGDEVFAASRDKLVVWGPNGELFRWKPRESGSRRWITSSALDRRAGAILVSTGENIYRVEDGKAKRLRRVPEHKDRKRIIDGLVALPNGELAYQLVDTYERPATINPQVKASTDASRADVPQLDATLARVTNVGESCYRAALERSLGARGGVRLRVLIHPSGAAIVHRADASEAKKLRRAVDCLVRELPEVTLPPHDRAGLLGLDVALQFRLLAVPKDE